VNGIQVKIKSPMDAIRHKIALVTEDRKHQGLVIHSSVKRNISIAKLKSIVFYGLINRKKENQAAAEYIDKLAIKTPSANEACINLSGGNQQKVVLAKWLYSDANILILDEPTRGIDVGAKHEIYLIINQLVKMGKSVIMISSEMPEVLGMSDRIIVLHKGKVTGEFENSVIKITPEQVMQSALG
jgi:ribose transport system ATP-binding protein